ncbi:MAG: SMC-Scp complex subunit ScpB [Legionellaceae bacterium]|nr:SMC-Scp complex subunit ScpB [Legionellaceae bacterium]HAF87168.1 SMC-Scp complex subunit ScpB [Legionellales bacterium]HCA89635.1 SMC-Scp complex subunit ScpB [Legionellales bacterium]|tara:strand:+ start:323 stop:889 length:567 start_codon:yes stop_codon:yes gene_type:complete
MNHSPDELKLILEALIMSQTKPVKLKELQAAFVSKPLLADIRAALQALAHDYAHRAIELKEHAQGFCFQTKPCYQTWIWRLNSDTPSHDSRALIETLSIIAYQQPVTRADIEAIRGVSVSSNMIKTLLERDWIKLSGYKTVAGKAALYVTTSEFLRHFNLTSLQDLPKLPSSSPKPVINATTPEPIYE